jgi:hypothetical protein
MAELRFTVEGARAVPLAASPQIALDVALQCVPARRIESVLLRCTVRIETAARAHDRAEQERLAGLFGPPEQWSRSARSLLWAQATCVLSGFETSTRCELLLPCSYDLAAAASAYLQRVHDGVVPISAQFSGSVFHRTDGGLQVEPIAWDREASFQLPVALFHTVIEQHFPNAGVLGLRRDLYQRLDRYRIARGLPDWERAVEQLLARSEELVP